MSDAVTRKVRLFKQTAYISNPDAREMERVAPMYQDKMEKWLRQHGWLPIVRNGQKIQYKYDDKGRLDLVAHCVYRGKRGALTESAIDLPTDVVTFERISNEN